MDEENTYIHMIRDNDQQVTAEQPICLKAPTNRCPSQQLWMQPNEEQDLQCQVRHLQTDRNNSWIALDEHRKHVRLSTSNRATNDRMAPKMTSFWHQPVNKPLKVVANEQLLGKTASVVFWPTTPHRVTIENSDGPTTKHGWTLPTNSHLTNHRRTEWNNQKRRCGTRPRNRVLLWRHTRSVSDISGDM